MAKFKVSCTGTAPYTLTVRNSSNSVVHTATSSDQEMEVPDAIYDTLSSFNFTLTNSNGQSFYQEIDNVTRILLAKYHVGRSVADGNYDNHVTGIQFGRDRNLTYCGVVFGQNDVDDDAAFNNPAWEQAFDHTQPISGSPVIGFDRVVREAYLSSDSPGDLATRISLRVGLNIVRDDNKLNNGTNRTKYWGWPDMNMRPDGTTPTYKSGNSVVPSQMIPSYSSPVVLEFVKQLTKKFFTRYKAAINDGTIMSIGWLTGTTGEAEYKTDCRETDGSKNILSQGDFHPEMMSRFRAKFPQYASTSNQEIANNDLQNNDLARRWSWFLADVMRDFEWKVIEYIHATVPGITRTKWVQVDVGSYVDALAPRRRTFMAFGRMHPRVMLIKSNDNTSFSTTDVAWKIGHLSALGRRFSAVTINEPSPQNPNFGDSSVRAETVIMMNVCEAQGVGISFITNVPNDIDYLLSATGVATNTYPQYKNEFKTVSGNKTLVRVTVNLSQILSNFDSFKAAYEALKSTESMTYADMYVVDDIDPGGGVSPTATPTPTRTPTPTPSPGASYSNLTTYINNNASSWGGNVLFNIKRSTGNVYSHTVGSAYNRDQNLEIMSLTKAVTAAVVLTCIQDGLFSNGINTTVGSLISSWNSGQRANITIKHILGHTSGIPDNQTNEGAVTTEAYVDWLAGSALEFNPGTQFAYRTVSYNVLARMCEIVTGKQWKVLWKERIRDTCGMGDSEYNPGEPYQPDFVGNLNNPLAGYKLYCSQNHFLNFLGMIRDNGVYNGNTILTSDSLNILFSDQTGGLGPWGGGMIRNDGGNEPTSESARGCYAWVNRTKGYAAVLFTQHNYPDSIGANIGLRDLVRSTL